MPSNREWLNDLAENDPQKLNVWFEAEHVDDNDEISKLKAERDEWRAKAEAKSAKRAAAVERLREMRHVDDYGDWVEAIAEVVKGTDKSNIGDYGMWESLIDLLEDDGLRSNDGVARSNGGVTNLEWLWEHDRDKLRDLGIDGDMSCRDCPNECVETEEGTPSEECQRRLVEWLMVPHSDPLSDSESSQRASESDQREQERACDSYREPMDVQHDINGTCPDGDETCPNHSKAQSKEAPTLSDLYGVFSDEKLQETPEQGQKDDALDSREKLEADLQALTERWHDYDGNYMRIYGTVAYAQVKELLDRQAEITAKRLCADCTPNVAEERDYLRTRVDELNTQVQEQSELIAARGKTIEALERFMSERKLKLKKQLESKTEQYRKLKAERDEYRELYEAAMSTDYGQLSKEHEQFREEISEMLDAAQQIERIRAKHETQLN